MSISATVFSGYFAVGLILMIVSVAAPGKERRAEHLDASEGTQFGAGLLIFIALLWPIWLFSLLSKDDNPKH